MKREEEVIADEGTAEIDAVFSDLISFVAALFILLFTMAYNKQLDDTYFERISAVMGGKEDPATKSKKMTEQKFVKDIQNYIRKEQLTQYAMVMVEEKKIRLVMNDPLLFKPGSAVLTESAEKVLDGFSTMMKHVKNPIVIEGHTDNRKVRDEDFDSSWELSMKRAYKVLRYMVETHNIPEKNLSLQAFGGQKPMYPNTTARNRKKNRRVELVIIRVKRAGA